jgi:tetratricopeptide (TPR) repeat protein
MAKQIKSAPDKAEAKAGEIVSKSEKFVENNKKTLLIAVAAVVLVVAAIVAVRYLYFIPKEKDAQTAMFPCENYFINQQWDLALNGDSIDCIGFLGIIDDYGITKSAKLAKAYAGICYYHIGKPDEALDYLKSFKADDAALSPAISSLIGDCLVETGKIEESVSYFKKAAEKAGEGSTLGPVYLTKAARSYEALKDYKKAVEVYKTIKYKYPNSQQAANADKYITKFESLEK